MILEFVERRILENEELNRVEMAANLWKLPYNCYSFKILSSGVIPLHKIFSNLKNDAAKHEQTNCHHCCHLLIIFLVFLL